MNGKTFRGLLLASLGYLISASVGTSVAIATHLPAGFLGILRGYDVGRDFLTIGTALSPPLVMLVAQVIFTACLFGRGRVKLVGVIGLTILGACYTLGQLGEPIVSHALTPAAFNIGEAVLVVANLVLPALMFVFGVRAWRGNSRAHRVVTE